jgi:hypothetical protein
MWMNEQLLGWFAIVNISSKERDMVYQLTDGQVDN